MENNTMQVCKWSLPIKRWGVLLFLLGNMLVTYGQYMYGTTGLLQMPSADMQRDKTFMIGEVFWHLKSYLLKNGGEIIIRLTIT